MKLYHYVTKGNNVLNVGLLSISKNPKADISYYTKRSGVKTHKGVCAWMEKCFKGRSRSIRCFTTPLQWTKKSLRIKELVDSCDLFELNLDLLVKDGLVEAIYLKPSIFDGHYFSMKSREKYLRCGADESLIKLKSEKDIDYKYHQTWDLCDDSKGLRMAPLQFYVLIVKDGVIPPKYLRKISK